MSINGLQQQYFANSLDGLTYLDVNGLSINGDVIDLTTLVPYTGADKPVDVGVQPIRTSYIPTINTDVVNLLALNQTTTGTVGYVDQYYVPYNNAISDTNLGNKAFTVGVAGNTSLSNLVRTELNNVLAGYNPASIVVGNNFGTITNAGGVYESTSTATFASLFLGTITAGEKYSVSISVKCIDPNYTTQIYIYEASAPNYLSGGIQLLSFAIPPNTTGFNVFTGTINPTLSNLLLVFSTQIVSGINTLYWNAFTLTGMGSVVKNLIAPSTGLDGANKTYVDTADALRVPYTGATGDVDLGIYKIIATTAQFTGVTSATPSLALGVDGSGNLRSFAVPTAVNLLPLNNTWTGTNSFNNTLTTGAGYTSNLNSIIQTIQTPSGQSAGNFTTTALPSGVPAGSVLSGSYLLTSGASSGAMAMWLGAYAYTNSENSFTFTGMSGSQTLALYVYQYNTAGTLAVQISDSVYTITTSSATVTGSFLANKFSAYSGKIVFYFQASAVNQSVSFSAFFHDIGSANINGSLSVTSVATETPITTIGLNSSNQLIKYTNPVSSVFTGSVGVSYIPYASSANVFANSLLYQSSGTQINCADSFYASNTITAGGIITASGGYTALDDRSLRPKDISPNTEQFFFASWNNDSSSPFADAIGMNGWADSSGGGTNVLMVRKDTFGIRQYQGTFGSTTPYVNSPAGSAQYMDVCMKGVGDNTKTVFQPIGGTWNVPLTVGSGTDNGGAQLITTNGNIHIDPATGKDLYLGYYRTFVNMQMYASNSINHRTRYQYHYANVNADAMAYFQNANSGSSAYFNLILNCNDGNVNHFINSNTRSADGGQNCYTIRNDSNGGIRLMANNGGFASYSATGTGGATFSNAIVSYQNGAGTGNIGTWAGWGFTLFCNATQPAGSQAAYGIVSNNYNTNFVVSLSPGVRWMDIQVWAAVHYHYVNGAMAAYLVGGGWVNVSDAREKEDINDLKTSRSLERIMKCKPKFYKRKYYDTDKDGKDATPAPQAVKDTICIGLLAQDVLQHTPHCVSGWKNDSIKETDDDDGSRYGISYNDFTVHLIGAVQEQQKQIETLTERSKVFEEHARTLERQLEEYKNLTEERFNKLAKMISGK